MKVAFDIADVFNTMAGPAVEIAYAGAPADNVLSLVESAVSEANHLTIDKTNSSKIQKVGIARVAGGVAAVGICKIQCNVRVLPHFVF